MRAPPSAVTHQPIWRSIRISVALVLAVVLIILGSSQTFGRFAPGQASIYSCPNRCYGTTYWKTPAEYSGAYTDISIAHFQCTLICATDGLGFIDNEIWLATDPFSTDKSNTDCGQQPPKGCWVEAGYMMHHDSPNEVFFWYDKRPGSGPGWEITSPVGPAPPLSHVTPTPTFSIAPNPRPTPTPTPTLPTSPAVPANYYGQTVHFMIIKDARSTPTSFLIFMYDNSTMSPIGGISSPNAMVGQKIMIGQELHGTDGAEADQATFTRNIYATQPLSSQNAVFKYDVQKEKGTISNGDVPIKNWNINPATSGSNPEGGEFMTRCCSLH